MGVYICKRCEGVFESKEGDCIPALGMGGKENGELVNEECATPAELYAYLPGFYETPEVSR